MIDQFRDLASHNWRVVRGRRCHLDQDDVANPFWEELEERLVCFELSANIEVWNPLVWEISTLLGFTAHLRQNALRGVKLVASHNDLLAFVELAEGLNLRQDAFG